MIIAPVLLAVAGLLASGSLFAHKRIMTYLAAAGALWESAWLLLTWIGRTFVSDQHGVVFIVGSLLALAGALYLLKWRKPTIPLGREHHDLVGEAVVVITTLIVLVGAFVIVRANGFFGYDYTVHGFYNGDVATFTALVNRSLHTKTLVNDNPFAAGASLEYPTLLHAGVAELIQNPASNWLRLLPTMTYVIIFVTIPLLFLVWDTAMHKPDTAWWVPASLIGLILTASWDTFVYPQSHFFVTGLLLLLVALLQRAGTERNGLKLLLELTAAPIAFVLLLSNAVFGVVAAAAIGVYLLWAATSGKSSRARIRWSWSGLVLVVAAFLLLAPGEPAFGGFGFSYTAAPDMLRLTPLLALLLAGIFSTLPKNPRNGLLPIVLLVFGFITFIFSVRDIVVANASRFFYLALLVAFPLMAIPLKKLVALVTTLFRKTKGLIPRTAVWGTALVGTGFLLLPSAASVASTYDNLLFKDEQTVTSAMWAALWWVEDNTTPDAVFLATPEEPFAIPALTGRTLLRTDYWLSPDDIVLGDMKAAFAGDIAAREEVFARADYLLLTKENRASFEPLPSVHQKVFDNNGVVIYRLAQAESSRLP